MTERIKIISKKILYKGWSTLSKYIISYTRTDGRVEEHIREIYNSGDGAAILLYNPEEQKILLIRQFRLPVLLNGHPSGFILECCAGMLDTLHPKEAIIKEVAEETGYLIKDATKVYEAFATPGAHMEKIHFYTAAYNKNQKIHEGGGDLSEQEDIEIVEYEYKEILKLLQSGHIIDAKTIILLQWVLREFGIGG
ncbi:MAG: NUDIX domain-containing protein [Saprospiraceae bacterium]|nr:NUDIX domain-containing protein [Saprospiraceae bacterium]